MNLQEMTIDALKKLAAEIDHEISKRSAAEKAKAIAQIRALAASAGLDLQEIIEQGMSVPAQRKPAPVKYRSPNGDTWTGRGRSPAWVKEWIESGKSLDDLRVL